MRTSVFAFARSDIICLVACIMSIASGSNPVPCNSDSSDLSGVAKLCVKSLNENKDVYAVPLACALVLFRCPVDDSVKPSKRDTICLFAQIRFIRISQVALLSAFLCAEPLWPCCYATWIVAAMFRFFPLQIDASVSLA